MKLAEKVLNRSKINEAKGDVINWDDNEDQMSALLDAVEKHFNVKMLKSVVKKILAEAKIDANDEVRRDNDGVSQADWLVEKMIGELLLNGKVER